MDSVFQFFGNLFGVIGFYGSMLLAAELAVGLVIFLIARLILVRSASGRRISIAYCLFTTAMASGSTVTIFSALILEDRTEDFLLAFFFWTVFFNCLSLAIMLLNLLPVEIAMKKFFPHGRKYYSIIGSGMIITVNFVTVLILSLVVPLYDETLKVSSINPKEWLVGFYPYPLLGMIVGLLVFYYVMQKVPPRNMI